MMKPAIIALAAAFALGTPLAASAQVEKRDHRAKKKQPETRDHRAKKKRKPRPANKGPVVRDHRGKDKPKVKPVVRDHGPKGVVVRDHRDKGATAPNLKVGIKIDLKSKPGPVVRDHRDKKRAVAKTTRDQYRVRAEARWKTRRPQLAKKEAERRANYQKRREQRIASRAERRRKRRAEIRAAWEAKFLADAKVQAELERHARRVARINRLRRLAEIKDRGKLVIRIEIVSMREDDHHAERLELLKANFTAQ